ncbi:MAG: hypothetical protein Fur002_04920 [Anaerolineales bacterium]
MSFLGNLFPGSNPSKNEKSPFEKWGFPPQITEIPAGRQALSSLSVGNQSVSTAFGPSIVIGLGATGRAVLNQWLEQTTHYESGSFAHVRILSLSQESQPSFAPHSAQPQSIAFGASLRSSHNSLEAFLEAPTLRRFYDWLRAALLNMRDAHVLIVGSVADPEIYLLGALLQILRIHPNVNLAPFLNITALLSLASPAPKNSTLSDGERYAALRETGRFTFSGLHKTLELPNSSQSVIRSALLDHLFLFDDSAFGKESEFDNGLGQALSEILFFLNHPSSKNFWETLKNDPTGDLRQRHHQPFAHTLGIKTFFVPLSEMQSYLAVRLARAVLFGERPSQDAADQFAPPQNQPADSALAETLARRWLTDNGAGAHPIFDWIWTVYPSNQTPLPDVQSGYRDLYSFKVSNSLVKFLNEPSAENKLKLAELALQVHIQRFNKLISAFEGASGAQPLERENLLRLLEAWRNTANYLCRALAQWQTAFAVRDEQPESQTLPASPASTAVRIELNWKTARADASTSDQTIYDLLRQRSQDAEEALQKIMGGESRFALTYNSNAPLDEVEKYYADSIRPELSHLGLPASAAFRAVRNRLEWWVRLTPSREPELMVVCWNSQANPSAPSLPNLQDCYLYEDKQKLVEAVLALTKTQTGGYEELTGEWYSRRLRELAAARDKTEEAYLSYDENISAPLNGDKRHYYLAAKNKTLTGNFLKEMFPLRVPSDVNELDGYDPTRFTVLTSRFSLPFSALNAAHQWYNAYNHFANFHAQTQEKIAAAYEDRIFRSQARKILFTPDFVMTLSDAQLITLFCQALFCNLISLKNHEMGSLPSWQVAPLAGFDALDLEADSAPRGLFEAFRKFTLEIPNDPSASLNPSKHFHPSCRAAFLKALRQETRAIRGGDKFKEMQSKFKSGILADWQARNDSLSQSFAALLQVELDEPLWEGWYS